MYDTPLTRPTTVGGLLGDIFRGTGQVARATGGVPLRNLILGPKSLEMLAARNRPMRAATMVAPPQGYQSILGMPSMLTPIAPDAPPPPTSEVGFLQDVPPPMPRPSLLSDQLNQIERQSTPAPSLLGRIGSGIRSAGKELGGLFEGEEGQLRARELSKALMTGPTRVPVSFGQSLVEGLAAGGEAIDAAKAEQAKIDMALAKAAKEGKGRGEASTASALREMYKAQNVISTIDDAYSRINPFTAGLGGAVLSSIPGTEARDVEGLLNTILANLGFDELKAMRAASPTGGALGQVSERENVLLQSAVRSLENSQSPNQIKKNLALVRKHYDRVLNLMKVEAYGVYDDRGNKIDIPSGEAGLKIVEAALAGKGYSIAGSSFNEGQIDDSEVQGQQGEVIRVTTEELNKELNKELGE